MPLVTVTLACNISNQRHLSCGVGITEDRRKGCSGFGNDVYTDFCDFTGKSPCSSILRVVKASDTACVLHPLVALFTAIIPFPLGVARVIGGCRFIPPQLEGIIVNYEEISVFL